MLLLSRFLLCPFGIHSLNWRSIYCSLRTFTHYGAPRVHLAIVSILVAHPLTRVFRQIAYFFSSYRDSQCHPSRVVGILDLKSFIGKDRSSSPGVTGCLIWNGGQSHNYGSSDSVDRALNEYSRNLAKVNRNCVRVHRMAGTQPPPPPDCIFLLKDHETEISTAGRACKVERRILYLFLYSKHE